MYKRQATDDVGNVAVCSFSITQNPLPTADAGNDTTIQLGAPVTLGGNPTGSGNPGPFSYLWFPAYDLDDPTVANPVATPTETTTYILYVLTPDGCAGTNTVTVSVNGNALNGSTSKQDGIRIAAYPNPASEILTVNADAGHNEAGIESMTLYLSLIHI